MGGSLAQVTDNYLISFLIVHAQTDITLNIIVLVVLIYSNVSERVFWVNYQLGRDWFHLFHHFFDYGFGLNHSFSKHLLFVDASLKTLALARLLNSGWVIICTST